MLLEVEARYATALNCAITRDSRTTCRISPKGLMIVPAISCPFMRFSLRKPRNSFTNSFVLGNKLHTEDQIFFIVTYDFISKSGIKVSFLYFISDVLQDHMLNQNLKDIILTAMGQVTCIPQFRCLQSSSSLIARSLKSSNKFPTFSTSARCSESPHSTIHC